MKCNYKTPAIEVINITTIAPCAASKLDVDVATEKEEDGVADANSRRSSWGNLWE